MTEMRNFASRRCHGTSSTWLEERYRRYYYAKTRNRISYQRIGGSDTREKQAIGMIHSCFPEIGANIYKVGGLNEAYNSEQVLKGADRFCRRCWI